MSLSISQHSRPTNNDAIYTLSSEIEVPGYTSSDKADPSKKIDDLAKKIIPLQPQLGMSNDVTFTLSSEIEVPGYSSTDKADRLFKLSLPAELVILITDYYYENSVPTHPSVAQLLSLYKLDENAHRCGPIPACVYGTRINYDDSNEEILELIADFTNYRANFINATSPVFHAFDFNVNINVDSLNLTPSDSISKYYYTWYNTCYNSSQTVYDVFHQAVYPPIGSRPLYKAGRFCHWVEKNYLHNADAFEDEDLTTFKPSIHIEYLVNHNFLMLKEAIK